MSYSSLHAQPSSRPPLAPLVAAGLDEVCHVALVTGVRAIANAGGRAWRGRSLS